MGAGCTKQTTAVNAPNNDHSNRHAQPPPSSSPPQKETKPSSTHASSKKPPLDDAPADDSPLVSLPDAVRVDHGGGASLANPNNNQEDEQPLVPSSQPRDRHDAILASPTTFEEMTQDKVDASHFFFFPAIRNFVSAAESRTFGHIYPARKKDNSKLFAIKVYKKDAVRSMLQLIVQERRFYGDARTSRFLVSLKHAFQDELHLYLALTWMGGGSLRDVMDAHPGGMSEEQARFHAAEMVLGLETLHAQKLIFRNLHPGNVLLAEDGHLRLSDFKLCRRVHRVNNYRASGKAGTRGYVAPEVLHNDLYSFKVDVYSLGVVLYEMLHGTRPFKDNREEVLEGDVLLDLKPSLSEAARSLIEACLEFDPQERLSLREIEKHPFFQSVNWSHFRRHKNTPPFAPGSVVEGQLDDSQAVNIDQVEQSDPVEERVPLAPRDVAMLKEWDYATDYKSRHLIMRELIGGSGSGNTGSRRSTLDTLRRSSTDPPKPFDHVELPSPKPGADPALRSAFLHT